MSMSINFQGEWIGRSNHGPCSFASLEKVRVFASDLEQASSNKASHTLQLKLQRFSTHKSVMKIIAVVVKNLTFVWTISAFFAVSVIVCDCEGSCQQR